MRRWIYGYAVLLASGMMFGQATPPPPAVSPEMVAGTWSIDGDVSGNALVSTCEFSVVQAAISGTCTGTDGKPMPVTGKLLDRSIQWTYESVWEGGKIVMSYATTFDKDGNMVGSVSVDPYAVSGQITAKRKAVGTPAE
ncbi:MAG TPA: hypothetical protein VGC07_06090 [Granulicella sp.]